MKYRSGAPANPHHEAAGQVTSEIIAGFKSVRLGNSRSIRVLLPPGYAEHQEQRYDLLYLNDGQDLAHLGMRATLDRLYASGSIRPMIVVGMDATSDRMNEYGTAGIHNAQGRGAKAAAFSRFLLEELKPFIDQRYRTLSGPAHAAIAGCSLGGLSAFDIAWTRPDVFGAVGVFSGSFWWRTDDRSWRTKQVSRIMHRRVRATSIPPAVRMWFQTGSDDETDDRDGNGVIDAIQDTTELIDELTAKGYRRGSDVVYLEVAGGRHDQATWGAVMPDFLTWLFPS